MESIWSATGKLPHFPPLWGEVHADVLVIGGGMAGLLCAHQLHQAGVSCIVAEADVLAGGVTKNTTAKITSQHALIYRKLLDTLGSEQAGLYLKANQDALQTYRSLCQNMDCDFENQDSFVYSRTGKEKLEAELTALQQLGYPAEFVQDLPLPFPVSGAVRFPDQAQFHPLKFLSAITEDLAVYESTPVRHLEKKKAVTDHGTIYADSVIVATHFPFLNTHGSYFMKLYQQRSYALSLENVPSFAGMYKDEAEDGLSFRSQGSSLILGGGGQRTGKPGGGWQELERISRQYYPQAVITHRWAAQDCMSLDGIPYIGQYSAKTPGLYVATGFNKWGMTSSMVAARVLTDLICGKRSPYADLFSPSRSMLHPQLGTNAMEAAKDLLTFSKKRCPHMGCALKWNPQEHSWDCPCHGSRFTESGKLIDNPATRNLKKQKYRK